MSFFRGSSRSRNRTFISCITGRFFTEPPGKPHLPVYTHVYIYTPMHTCIHSICVCSVAQSCLTFCDPLDCSPPGSSAVEFFRQAYWSGLSFPLPEDLLDTGIEPVFSCIAGRFFTTEPSGKPIHRIYIHPYIPIHTYIHLYAHTHTFVHTHTYRCICERVCTVYTCVNVFHEIGSMLL